MGWLSGAVPGSGQVLRATLGAGTARAEQASSLVHSWAESVWALQMQ